MVMILKKTANSCTSMIGHQLVFQLLLVSCTKVRLAITPIHHCDIYTLTFVLLLPALALTVGNKCKLWMNIPGWIAACSKSCLPLRLLGKKKTHSVTPGWTLFMHTIFLVVRLNILNAKAGSGRARAAFQHKWLFYWLSGTTCNNPAVPQQIPVTSTSLQPCQTSALLSSALLFQPSSQVRAESMSHLTAATRTCQYQSDVFSSILPSPLKGSQLPVAGLH